ncbi:hypothetical protein PTKU46_94390 [Paraburkholderia terrae]
MLVNNDGIYIGKPFTEHTLEDIAAVTNANWASSYHFTQFAIAEMETQSGSQRGQRDGQLRRWRAHGYAFSTGRTADRWRFRSDRHGRNPAC